MKPEHAQLLIECHHRQEAHAATQRPPAWATWETRGWDDEREHGPAYASGEWFGPIPEFMRMRFQRAIRDLERDGLLETWSKGGRKLSHVKLTAAGTAMAQRLVDKEAPADA